MALSHKTWSDVRLAIAASAKKDFTTQFRLAGLDPARHAGYADWTDVDFAGSDLDGFDFTGSKLFRAKFKGAKIWKARFDQALLDKVIQDGRSRDADDRLKGPHAPAILQGGCRLREADDWKEFAKPENWSRPTTKPEGSDLPIGAIFIDAPFAPQMVVVPPGKYMRGTSPAEMAALEKEFGEDYGKIIKWEGPQLEVIIAAPFAVGRFPVTFEEWDLAQKHPDWKKLSKIAPREPKDQKWRRDQRPVIDVSWNDAQGYVTWLSGVTGRDYRLLSEAEWEYVARAGTETRYSFGDDAKRLDEFAWIRENSEKKTQPVGQKKSNAFGLHDVHGNVWEWCEDEWYDSYDGAPDDGTARTSKKKGGVRVVRGGSWLNDPRFLRSAFRFNFTTVNRDDNLGFRVARTLTS